jgi:hypothetical protein
MPDTTFRRPKTKPKYAFRYYDYGRTEIHPPISILVIFSRGFYYFGIKAFNHL